MDEQSLAAFFRNPNTKAPSVPEFQWAHSVFLDLPEELQDYVGALCKHVIDDIRTRRGLTRFSCWGGLELIFKTVIYYEPGDDNGQIQI